MKRTLLLGACVFGLGCLDGPTDEGGLEASKPLLDLPTTPEAEGADPRGDFGTFAVATVPTVRQAPANVRDLQVREEQAANVEIFSKFDPESIKSTTEAFRMRTGVQR
jgi:hypothetical protein